MAVGKRNRRGIGPDVYVFLVLSLTAFSLLLFTTRSFITDIRDTGLSVFSGVREGVHEISVFFSGTVNSISELASLRERYNELFERVARYEQLERGAADIRQENYRLREQLGFALSVSFRHIPAEIIGRDPDNVYQSLVLNKGASQGVVKDMPVIAYQNGVQVLIGKIIQSAPYESIVLPLYDTNCFVAARFAGNRYEGLVGGKGNSAQPLVMSAVDKRARDNVQKGDVVVSSGMGGVYPAGITVGRVVRTVSSEKDAAVRVELECAADFSKLEYVFIIDAASYKADTENK